MQFIQNPSLADFEILGGDCANIEQKSWLGRSFRTFCFWGGLKECCEVKEQVGRVIAYLLF